MKKFFKYLGIIVVVIGAIYGAYFLFKKFISSASSAPEEFKESEESVKKKYSKYLLLLRTNEKLKKQLDQTCSRIYRVASLCVFIISVSPLLVLYLFTNSLSLRSIELYIAFSPYVFSWVYYILFSKDFSFREFNELLKLRIKNWVYGKYINIEGKIDTMTSVTQELKPILNNNKLVPPAGVFDDWEL